MPEPLRKEVVTRTLLCTFSEYTDFWKRLLSVNTRDVGRNNQGVGLCGSFGFRRNELIN